MDYIDKKDLFIEMMVSKAKGTLTNKAKKMVELIAINAIIKLPYESIDDKKDCQQNGAFKLFEKWHGFDPEKTENPFAYLTEIFKRGCYEEFDKLYKEKGDPENFYKLVSLESSNDGDGLHNII